MNISSALLATTKAKTRQYQNNSKNNVNDFLVIVDHLLLLIIIFNLTSSRCSCCVWRLKVLTVRFQKLTSNSLPFAFVAELPPVFKWSRVLARKLAPSLNVYVVTLHVAWRYGGNWSCQDALQTYKRKPLNSIQLPSNANKYYIYIYEVIIMIISTSYLSWPCRSSVSSESFLKFFVNARKKTI